MGSRIFKLSRVVLVDTHLFLVQIEHHLMLTTLEPLVLNTRPLNALLDLLHQRVAPLVARHPVIFSMRNKKRLARVPILPLVRHDVFAALQRAKSGYGLHPWLDHGIFAPCFLARRVTGELFCLEVDGVFKIREDLDQIGSESGDDGWGGLWGEVGGGR